MGAPRLGDGQALHKGVADRAVLLAHALAPLRAWRRHRPELDAAACGELHRVQHHIVGFQANVLLSAGCGLDTDACKQPQSKAAF